MKENRINKVYINNLCEKIKAIEGVLDVDTSDIKYNENGELYYYNNNVRVSKKDFRNL